MSSAVIAEVLLLSDTGLYDLEKKKYKYICKEEKIAIYLKKSEL